MSNKQFKKSYTGLIFFNNAPLFCEVPGTDVLLNRPPRSTPCEISSSKRAPPCSKPRTALSLIEGVDAHYGASLRSQNFFVPLSSCRQNFSPLLFFFLLLFARELTSARAVLLALQHTVHARRYMHATRRE